MGFRNSTNILPGFFLSLFFGQNSPEFNATGTHGIFKFLYKANIPLLYSGSELITLLVPSGNINIV